MIDAESDEKTWAYYLALLGNPAAEGIGSYDDFKAKLGAKKEPASKPAEKSFSVREVVAHSQSILDGFSPT